jgi:hypothetical protein
MLPCIGLKNQIFVILLIFPITLNFMFIFKLCWQAHYSHKNSAFASDHYRNASLSRYKYIQHTKNYYCTWNGSLKYYFLSFCKNLDDSSSQKCMREKRTTTLQGRLVYICSANFFGNFGWFLQHSQLRERAAFFRSLGWGVSSLWLHVFHFSSVCPLRRRGAYCFAVVGR